MLCGTVVLTQEEGNLSCGCSASLAAPEPAALPRAVTRTTSHPPMPHRLKRRHRTPGPAACVHSPGPSRAACRASALPPGHHLSSQNVSQFLTRKCGCHSYTAVIRCLVLKPINWMSALKIRANTHRWDDVRQHLTHSPPCAASVVRTVTVPSTVGNTRTWKG